MAGERQFVQTLGGHGRAQLVRNSFSVFCFGEGRGARGWREAAFSDLGEHAGHGW